jgi:hypothetical protein
MVCQELLRNTERRNAFYQQLDGLFYIGRSHDLGSGDEKGVVINDMGDQYVLLELGAIHLPKRVRMLRSD